MAFGSISVTIECRGAVGSEAILRSFGRGRVPVRSARSREVILGSHGSNFSKRERVGTSTATSESRDRDGGAVEVEILGQTLSVRSDRDPEFVKQLAAYVDEKLGELQEAAPQAPTDKLLMMTSLTVAEELFEARDELENLQAEVEERAAMMRELIQKLDA